MKRFVPADSHTLQCDVDGALRLASFFNMFSRVVASRHLTVESLTVRPSNSSNHWHATIKLKEAIPVIERIALQAILGSDRHREFCNWGRARNKAPYPILLFEKKRGHAR